MSTRKEHPYSEAQRRWAFAEAERDGEISDQKAHEWSKRVENENLPEKSNRSEKKSQLVVDGFKTGLLQGLFKD